MRRRTPRSTLFPYTTLFRSRGIDSAVDRGPVPERVLVAAHDRGDRKSTRLNSSHVSISYAVFCLKKKNLDIAPKNLEKVIYFAAHLITWVDDELRHLDLASL